MIEILDDKKTILDTHKSNTLLDESLTQKEDMLKTETDLSINNDDIPEPNCLALTVKKDYNLTIVKNVFTTTGRLSWKVILATIALNFLNMIF